MATTMSITEIVARFCSDTPTTFLHVGSVYFVYKTLGTLSRLIWPPQRYVWIPKHTWSTPGPDEDYKWLFLEHGYKFLQAASLAVTTVMAVDNFVVGRGPFALKFLEAAATVGGTMLACYGVPLLWDVMTSRDFWERSLYAYGQAIDRLTMPAERPWQAVKRKADRKDKKSSTQDDAEETLAQVVNFPAEEAGKEEEVADAGSVVIVAEEIDAYEASLQSSAEKTTARSEGTHRDHQLFQVNKELNLAKERIARLNNELAQARQEICDAKNETDQVKREAQTLRDAKPLSQQEAEQQVSLAKREAEDAKTSEAHAQRMLAEARSERSGAETRASQANQRAYEAMKEANVASNKALQARKDADGAKTEASEARTKAEQAQREMQKAKKEAAEAQKGAAQARKEAAESSKKMKAMSQASQKASNFSAQREEEDDYVTADSIYRQVWTAE